MRTIYVLQGSCGEHSDRTDWIVGAYFDKARADADGAKAIYEGCAFSKLDEAIDLKYGYKEENIAREAELRKTMLTIDPSAQFDYTGTTYWVVEITLNAATVDK